MWVVKRKSGCLEIVASLYFILSHESLLLYMYRERYIYMYYVITSMHSLNANNNLDGNIIHMYFHTQTGQWVYGEGV